MNKISLVIPYYKTENIIPKKFEEWQSYDEDVQNNLEIIIVDDGSPERTRFEEHWIDTNLNIKLYRITTDIPWNECGANNLGVKVASNEWIFRSDVDWSIPNNTIKNIMNIELCKDSLYMFCGMNFVSKERVSYPPNIFVMHKETFWKIGGYDEDTRGHYGSDLSFRYRVDFVFGIRRIPTEWFVESHVDASKQHGLERDPSFCYQQLEEKKQNKTVVPDSHLRFEWKQIK